jgi:hypothetical protein
MIYKKFVYYQCLLGTKNELLDVERYHDRIIIIYSYSMKISSTVRSSSKQLNDRTIPLFFYKSFRHRSGTTHVIFVDRHPIKRKKIKKCCFEIKNTRHYFKNTVKQLKTSGGALLRIRINGFKSLSKSNNI